MHMSPDTARPAEGTLTRHVEDAGDHLGGVLAGLQGALRDASDNATLDMLEWMVADLLTASAAIDAAHIACLAMRSEAG